MNKINQKAEKKSLIEAMAEYAVETDSISAWDAIESFAEILVEEFEHSMPGIELTQDQGDWLQYCVEKFLGDKIADEATELMDEWAEDTEESYQAMKEARYA